MESSPNRRRSFALSTRIFDVKRCTIWRSSKVPPSCVHCLSGCTHRFSWCVNSVLPCNPRANPPPFVQVISDANFFFLSRCHFLPIEPIMFKFKGDILGGYLRLISLLKDLQIFSKRNNNFFNNKKSESQIFVFNDKSLIVKDGLCQVLVL